MGRREKENIHKTQAFQIQFRYSKLIKPKMAIVKDPVHRLKNRIKKNC